MDRRTRRIVSYLVLVGLTTVGFAPAYNVGMSVREGRSQPLYRSFEAAVRDATGCTVLAVERDGEYLTEFDPGRFRFEADDEVVVAGTDESGSRFEDRFVE